MAVASAAPHHTHPIPFVAKALLRPFVSRTDNGIAGVTITYFDIDGRRVGSSLSTLADVEKHAHDLLAAVAAARATDPAVVPISLMPRSESVLMPDVRMGEAA